MFFYFILYAHGEKIPLERMYSMHTDEVNFVSKNYLHQKYKILAIDLRQKNILLWLEYVANQILKFRYFRMP